MIEGYLDEKLWETAQILAEEKRTEQAVVVINSIASHALGRYSGKPVNVELRSIPKKELRDEQLKSMKKLGIEVSLLVDKSQYEEAQEKAIEYIDGIVSLLASSPEEEQRLRKSYFKHLIQIGNKPQGIKGILEKVRRPHIVKMSEEPSELSSPKSYLGGIIKRNSLGTQIVTTEETYTTSDAAQILHVSDQTIRRMCEAGKFPGASRTEGGHWRIPKKYFKVTLEQSMQIDKDLSDIRSKSLKGGHVDEFNL